MIQHVRQLDTRGCGIACLAMLLGVSYAEAKYRLFGRRPPQDVSVDISPINRELRRAGIGTKYDMRRRDRPCLVPLTWPKYYMPGDGHFVVWDPDRPDVYLDPCERMFTPVADPLYRVARAISSRHGEPILIVKG